MMLPSRNFPRYELKYTISEELVDPIRESIAAVCKPDPFADKKTGRYVVNNFYFETPDRRFYHDTVFRQPLRVKPRMRYYGDKAPDKLWLELKYRSHSTVWKHRHFVDIADWPETLGLSGGNHAGTKLSGLPDKFEDVVNLSGAQPIVHVRYVREPYVSELDRYGRVTFDRRLSCRPVSDPADIYADSSLFTPYDDPVSTREAFSPVVLEIKIERDIPSWAIALIRKFELLQRGFSKYVYGVDSLSGRAERYMRHFSI